MKCSLCDRDIKGDYFDNREKQFCENYLKESFVYYGLKSLELICNTEE